MKACMKKTLLREIKGVAWTLPALIFLGVFTLYPMINAVITSFYNWNLTGRKKYIAGYNYQKLFSNPEIFETIGRTFEHKRCQSNGCAAGMLFYGFQRFFFYSGLLYFYRKI